jgi:hypothetical protein
MKIQRIFAILVLVTGLLSACAPAQPAIPTAGPVATSAPTATTAPTETPASTAVISATAPAAPVELNCRDQANVESGRFRGENNTWGKGTLTGWSQCIGLNASAEGTLTGRWTWDWPSSGGNVKAYPEMIFGQKPGTKSTSADLPKQISSLSEALIAYDVSSTHTGNGNLAFDFWLTDTQNPDKWGVPPITTEIMIWLEGYGMSPGGRWTENIDIDGVTYSVYVAKHWGDGWDYVAFNRTKPQTGEGSINLVNFLAYMQSKDLITGQEYVASIEFGNEVVSGTGETNLNKFTVSVR